MLIEAYAQISNKIRDHAMIKETFARFLVTDIPFESTKFESFKNNESVDNIIHTPDF